jgi:hypothetical protein
MTTGSTGEPRKDRVRVGTGTSEADEAAVAGRAAAEAALAGLAGEPAALVLVYASVRYDLADLLAGVRSVSGAAPLLGSTTSGHFCDGEVTRPGRGVAVLALTAGPYRYGVASVAGLRADGRAAGRTLARAAKEAASGGGAPYSALMVLADGLAGNQHDLLNGLHKVTGAAVPVVGGAAGDDRQLSRTSVFDGDRVLTDGAVAVWIDSPWPLPVVARHGWSPVSLPLLVTKVDGPIVHEIAGRPAEAVFREHFRDHELDQELGWVRRPGYHSAHAFGLIEPDGSLLIRGAYLDDEGVLRTFCPLPTYAPVQIVSCTPDDLLEVTEPVVREVTAGRDASVVLAFSCVARLDVLRDRGPEEAERLQAAAGPATSTFGFYTYGEVARVNSVTGYHNATLAAVAL